MPSLVFRSLLVVPIILLPVLMVYDAAFRWKMSTTPHRVSYDAIAARYLHDTPAKLEDDTWVDNIGELTFFYSGMASFLSGGHLFVLILEAWKGKEIAVPLPKEWYGAVFYTLGLPVLPHAVAVYWTFVKNWNLSGDLKCTFNYKMHKMRCTPITTYCVLPELYPDLLSKDELSIDCDRAKNMAWLMLLNITSTLVVFTSFAWIELSRVRRFRADAEATGKVKSLEAQDSGNKEKAEHGKGSVAASLLEKGDAGPKEGVPRWRMISYIITMVWTSYNAVIFVIRLFE